VGGFPGRRWRAVAGASAMAGGVLAAGVLVAPVAEATQSRSGSRSPSPKQRAGHGHLVRSLDEVLVPVGVDGLREGHEVIGAWDGYQQFKVTRDATGGLVLRPVNLDGSVGDPEPVDHYRGETFYLDSHSSSAVPPSPSGSPEESSLSEALTPGSASTASAPVSTSSHRDGADVRQVPAPSVLKPQVVLDMRKQSNNRKLADLFYDHVGRVFLANEVAARLGVSDSEIHDISTRLGQLARIDAIKRVALGGYRAWTAAEIQAGDSNKSVREKVDRYLRTKTKSRKSEIVKWAYERKADFMIDDLIHAKPEMATGNASPQRTLVETAVGQLVREGVLLLKTPQRGHNPAEYEPDLDGYAHDQGVPEGQG
jgi:hypothetical protein